MMGSVKIGKVFFWLVIFSLWPPLATGVRADGLILPPRGGRVKQTAQKAVIFYNGGRETLIVSPSFQGDASEFGWIIPTPSRPEIGKSTDALFVSLEELTSFRRRTYPSFFDSFFGLGITQGRIEEEVKVWEQKRVGVYNLTVLSAASYLDLVDWLTSHGFVLPAGGEALFAEYVREGWFFTVATIGNRGGLVTTEQLNAGHAEPIKLVFRSERLVYPLKITGLGSFGVVSAPGRVMAATSSARIRPRPPKTPYLPVERETPPGLDDAPEVRLYIFADHKQEILGFNTVYAGWISADIFRQMADYSGESWLAGQGNAYLTVVNKYMSLGEITGDLYPRQAGDDKPMGGGAGSLVNLSRAVALASLIILLEVVVLAIYFGVKRRRNV